MEIDKYDSETTGPGYSALMCSKHLQKPFYFIMGDCLIDSPLPHIDGNWLGVSPTSFPEKYSTINVNNDDDIISFMDKNIDGYDLAFIGLGSIFDYETFWSELQNNIKNNELVSAFENPKNYPTFKIKKLKWLDTGNLDDLEKAKEYFNDNPLSLKKDVSEITYKDDNIFLKFTPDTEILKRRTIRAKHLGHNIPNNFGFTDDFIYYDWVEGDTLYELDDLFVFKNFLRVFEEKIKITTKCNIDDIRKFYIDKTNKRVNLFLPKYHSDYYNLEHEINGIKLPSMKSVLETIDFQQLDNNPFYNLFHGDLHFDNIVYNKNEDKYYYIDWRDSFGDSVDFGDLYYDLSKFYGGLLIPYNLMKNENLITYNEG